MPPEPAVPGMPPEPAVPGMPTVLEPVKELGAT